LQDRHVNCSRSMEAMMMVDADPVIAQNEMA
jgi:hypothetical protein